MNTYCIDLFSGCGGLSLGLHQAGFNLALAIEAHPDAFSTYYTNLLCTKFLRNDWPNWLDKEPHNIVAFLDAHQQQLRELRGSIALIAGGPPCQGFSTNGRRNPDDPRSMLVDAYLNVVEVVRPNLLLLENVRGFVSMPHSTGTTYAEAVHRALRDYGYQVWSEIVVSTDWGIPQTRPRYICIAALQGSLPGVNPFERLRTSRRRFLSERGLWPGPTTVRDAISDLLFRQDDPSPDPEWGSRGYVAVERTEQDHLTNYQRLMRTMSASQPSDRRIPRHTKPVIDRFRQIHESCRPGTTLGPKDRKKFGLGKRSTTLLDGNKPAPTITTLPDDFIHYSDARTLTVREHARLQSFPDWFSFRGPYTTGGLRRRDACPRYTQVGNAVPPLLAEALGRTLLELLADQQRP